MYYNRAIESPIISAAKSFACITLYGPRQVGKSTVVRHVFGDKIKAVTLDDYSNLYLAKNDPKMFLRQYGWPLIIDEVQKAKELLPEIKILIDENKYKWLEEGKPVQLMYILTGSSQFELQEGVSESLAGRTAVLNMSSFSQHEKARQEWVPFDPDVDKLYELEKKNGIPSRSRFEVFSEIFEGGMPELVSTGIPRDMFFRSYVDTYIEKDVKKLISASLEFQFRNFLSIVALRTAQELNYDDIARSTGIDVKTCKRWLSILYTSGLIVFLQPYMPNASSRIIKSPKLYFMDTGLCAWLCGWQDGEMLEKSSMSGAFFETFVVSEIIKSFSNGNEDYRTRLFYVRTRGQKEVDLIFDTRDGLVPIEIKKGIEPSNPTKNFDSLLVFKRPVKKGLIVCCRDRVFPLNRKAFYCPVGLL